MTWLTDIAGLSKPATKLIESVSSAIGAIYEPIRIRRKATAEGDAELILTRNRLKITELERRATERLVNRELRRQENIEAVLWMICPRLLMILLLTRLGFTIFLINARMLVTDVCNPYGQNYSQVRWRSQANFPFALLILLNQPYSP